MKQRYVGKHPLSEFSMLAFAGGQAQDRITIARYLGSGNSLDQRAYREVAEDVLASLEFQGLIVPIVDGLIESTIARQLGDSQ